MIVKGFEEVDPSFIELFHTNVHVFMGSSHIYSFIGIGSSGDHGNELFLSGSLFFHIGVSEEWSGDFISKHVNIEFVDDRADSWLSS